MWTYQHLVRAADVVNLSDENINTCSETQCLFDGCKEVGLDMLLDKIKISNKASKKCDKL